mmetsp:Transcript_77043/g.198395  ORF Transcript_77043/g.198395 Transcript_77043/m.198395 type:complete len:276 (+) Transcript_77043:783-1610(+)
MVPADPLLRVLAQRDVVVHAALGHVRLHPVGAGRLFERLEEVRQPLLRDDRAPGAAPQGACAAQRHGSAQRAGTAELQGAGRAADVAAQRADRAGRAAGAHQEARGEAAAASGVELGDGLELLGARAARPVHFAVRHVRRDCLQLVPEEQEGVRERFARVFHRQRVPGRSAVDLAVAREARQPQQVLAACFEEAVPQTNHLRVGAIGLERLDGHVGEVLRPDALRGAGLQRARRDHLCMWVRLWQLIQVVAHQPGPVHLDRRRAQRQRRQPWRRG